MKETCKILYEELSPRYLRTPQTPEEWTDVSDGFWQRWNLPNTCGTRFKVTFTGKSRTISGAIDGKHVQIKKPPNSGSNYFNYKGHFSMVLLAICDARYRVIYANFGNYGADSDVRIFGRSDFLRLLEAGALNLPADAALPNSERVLPYFFVADAAFPLSQNLMKPVPGNGLTVEERRYNYRFVQRNIVKLFAIKRSLESAEDDA